MGKIQMAYTSSGKIQTLLVLLVGFLILVGSKVLASSKVAGAFALTTMTTL